MFPEIPYSLIPEVITVPTNYLVRPEQCSECKINLHESLKWESSRPSDPSKIVFGVQYTEMPTSKEIFCPTCKKVFAHKATEPIKILLYINAIGDGEGFSQLLLKETFSVSKYDTSLINNIEKGTPCYWNVTPTSSKEKRNICSAKIMRIKEPWDKSTGYTTGTPRFFIPDKWNFEIAAIIYFNKFDMFAYPSEQDKVRFKIPLRLLEFPKEFYGNTENIVVT